MVRSTFLTVCALILIFPGVSSADILFEGYSKILSGDEHIGYVVSRYEFDNKKKHFISTYYLKTGKGVNEITESLKAYATVDLVPISYEYTTMVGKDVKMIDAKFKNDTLSAVIKRNGKIERLETKAPKGTFLSTFLVYVMLKSKQGLKSESSYEYQAIAEEDGKVTKGHAHVGKEEVFNGSRAFKILNTFKDSKFVSYVNERGEVLGTDVFGQAITAQLVAHPSEATANQSYSANVLKTLFGQVPAGQANVKYRALKLKENEDRAAEEGTFVPQGQGVIIKSAPATPEAPATTTKGTNR